MHIKQTLIHNITQIDISLPYHHLIVGLYRVGCAQKTCWYRNSFGIKDICTNCKNLFHQPILSYKFIQHLGYASCFLRQRNYLIVVLSCLLWLFTKSNIYNYKYYKHRVKLIFTCSSDRSPNQLLQSKLDY